MEKLIKFRQLGLTETTLSALKTKGFEEPTPIQEKIIPVFLAKQIDLIAQAQTGTGKTAAFGLPLIEKLEPNKNCVQAIILTPTRELALQVSEEINSLMGTKRLFIAAIYGGQSIEQQLYRLRRGVDIVVGTPGRIIDHINRGSLKLDKITYFILDEADEMLDMGFIEDIEEILKHANKDRRTLLFSATMPDHVLVLARKYMKQYEFIAVKKEQLTTDLTDQIYFEVNERDKFDALCRIIDVEKEFYGLVFCRTKIDVDEIGKKLIDRGFDAEFLHGDISQFQRERILNKFKQKKINVLVATDVAARGIDISNLTHVINYALPQDPEYYVHRVGRTGRAGKKGTAITFVTPTEYRKLVFIQKISKSKIRKEKLPGIKAVIDLKRERIKDKLFELIASGDFSDYQALAEQLLQGNQPVNVVAAVLRHAFADELDIKSYNEIKEVSIDRQGKTRLFVALGKNRDMTPGKLVDYIKKETGVHPNAIQEVRVFESFSFITVPFEDAENIIATFKQKAAGRRPLVDRAKDKR